MPTQGLSSRTRSLRDLSFFHWPAAAFAAVVQTLQTLNAVFDAIAPERAFASSASRSRSQSVTVTSGQGLSMIGAMCVR